MIKFSSAVKRASIFSIFSLYALFWFSACSPVQQRIPEASKVKTSAQIKADNIEIRLKWRKTLAWNIDCEDSFQASYAGLGSGVEVYALQNGLELVSVLCSAGAYQPSFVYFIVDKNAGVDRVIAMKFNRVESADGESLQSNPQFELWGEPMIDAAHGELNILNLARQTGDCGSWAVYALQGKLAELLELWTRFPCPAKIEAHAEQRIGMPPQGWIRVDHENMLH